MTVSANDAHPYPIYNARFRLKFPILDADGDLVTGATALDSELSQDDATFVDAVNEAIEIATASGMYYLDLIATELDTRATAGIVKTSTVGAKTTPFVLYPVRLPVIRTGTAQAGSTSSITLDSGASAITDYYVGCFINITNDSPSNALGQARRITAYDGSTKVATLEGAYGTNPSSASTFEVLATAEWNWRRADVNALLGTAWLTPAVAGTPDVNAKLVGGTAQPQGFVKNVAYNNFTFFMVDSTDHVTGKTGAVVAAQRSLDGAAFAACANAVSEVSNGAYKINLAAADLNGNIVMLRFTATGADATVVTIKTVL